MAVSVKLGKQPAVADPRIPRMSVALPSLPPPPPASNWYAAVGEWGMLGNDQWGDCVQAAGLHSILQMSTYTGRPMVPTVKEAEQWYEAAGYRPGDPATDIGSYVLGPSGMVPYWHNHGVMCGRRLNKVAGFVQITRRNPVEWRQGVHIFGGLMIGLSLPEVIVAGDTVPYVWANTRGPVAGGHEVWINGYQQVGATWFYDLISWGARYRATEEFLQHCVDEAVCVVNPVEINARGVNAAGVSFAALTTDLRLI